MRSLKNELPANYRILYVFYHFETMQSTRYSDKVTVHVRNLVYIHQFCSKCENEEDIERDCAQCGKRKHSFWDSPFGDMLCVRSPTLGQKDRRNRTQGQGIRPSFHSELGHPIEMAARIDHERTDKNVHEDAAHGLSR